MIEMINKIELARDYRGKLYISNAWANGDVVIDRNSDTRPTLEIENGVVIDILHDEIIVSEFEPFEAIEGVYTLGN
jgi:hypothetical protein